jgi:hypothetical protein
MTGSLPADPDSRPRDDLTPRVFRALYQAFDLHTVGGTHIAVPTGTPCFAAPSLGEVARQISTREHPAPAAPPDSPPGPLDRRPAP